MRRFFLATALCLAGGSRALAGYYIYPPQTVPWTVSGTATETATVISTFTASGTAVFNGYLGYYQGWSPIFTLYQPQYVTISRSGSTPNGVNIVPNCSGVGYSVADGQNWLGAGQYCLLIAGYNGPVSASVTFTNPVTSIFQDTATVSGSFYVSYDTSTAMFVSTGTTSYVLNFTRPDGTLASGTLSNVVVVSTTTNSNVTLQRTGTTAGILSATIKLYVYVEYPPFTPSYSTATIVQTQHLLTGPVNLSWSPSTDPDGDPVSYNVFVGTAPGSLSLAISTTSTTYPAYALSFGATYYWQVAGVDNAGLASTGPLAAFQVALLNHPPNAFAALTGTGFMATRASTATLSWEIKGDPDGDVVNYALSISTVPGSLSLVQVSTQASYLLPLQYGTTFYWSVSAFDLYGASTTITGGMQSFLPTFLNDPPGTPRLTAPFIGSPSIKTMKNNVAVSWNQVTNPEGDPITYTVYLGNSPQNMPIFTQIHQSSGSLSLATQPSASQPVSQVSISGNTVQLALSGLSYYQNYYLQVAASNPYGATSSTAVQAFTLSPLSGFPKAYNYPNPFSANRGGTNIVFNAPASGYARATVEIYSELQDLLFKQDYPNIPPGISQVHIDGRDRFGRAFFNGSYVCRVLFSGPDDKEIFYLLVVK